MRCARKAQTNSPCSRARACDMQVNRMPSAGSLLSGLTTSNIVVVVSNKDARALFLAVEQVVSTNNR